MFGIGSIGALPGLMTGMNATPVAALPPLPPLTPQPRPVQGTPPSSPHPAPVPNPVQGSKMSISYLLATPVPSPTPIVAHDTHVNVVTVDATGPVARTPSSPLGASSPRSQCSGTTSVTAFSPTNSPPLLCRLKSFGSGHGLFPLPTGMYPSAFKSKPSSESENVVGDDFLKMRPIDPSRQDQGVDLPSFRGLFGIYLRPQPLRNRTLPLPRTPEENARSRPMLPSIHDQLGDILAQPALPRRLPPVLHSVVLELEPDHEEQLVYNSGDDTDTYVDDSSTLIDDSDWDDYSLDDPSEVHTDVSDESEFDIHEVEDEEEVQMLIEGEVELELELEPGAYYYDGDDEDGDSVLYWQDAPMVIDENNPFWD